MVLLFFFFSYVVYGWSVIDENVCIVCLLEMGEFCVVVVNVFIIVDVVFFID